MRESGDRQSALFDIHRSLTELGLPEWSWAIVDWLDHYDGLEVHLPESDDPLLCARRVFAEMASQGDGKAIASDVAKRLESEPFLRYHVDWVDENGTPIGPSWVPIGSSGMRFWDFVALQPDEASQLRVRKLADTHVDPKLMRNILVLGYLRFYLAKSDE